nr:hypothetical protein MSCUHULR_MSCUHULR_CDS_0008 [Microvirus sp.]
MSKLSIPKLLKVLSYINDVFKFIFPFLQKIEDGKANKDNDNVEPKNN